VNIARMLRHMWMTRWYMQSVFTSRVLDAIEQAVRKAECSHGGEIRFAVEPELTTLDLFHNLSSRQRALQVFGELRVWDTEQNNGVLIYVLLADHCVEIIADRGYAQRVSDEEWRGVCEAIELAFRNNEFERGSVQGVEAASKLIARHYPAIDRNELPDRPVML
jgi:uncharacterized membrane protein